MLLTAELNARVLSVSIDASGYPATSSGRLAAFYSDHLPVIVTLSDSALRWGAPPVLLLLLALLLATA